MANTRIRHRPCRKTRSNAGHSYRPPIEQARHPHENAQPYGGIPRQAAERWGVDMRPPVFHGTHDVDDQTRGAHHFGAEKLPGRLQERLVLKQFLCLVVFRPSIVSPDGAEERIERWSPISSP